MARRLERGWRGTVGSRGHKRSMASTPLSLHPLLFGQGPLLANWPENCWHSHVLPHPHTPIPCPLSLLRREHTKKDRSLLGQCNPSAKKKKGRSLTRWLERDCTRPSTPPPSPTYFSKDENLWWDSNEVIVRVLVRASRRVLMGTPGWSVASPAPGWPL